ncbi:MAG: 2-oxoacid:acceptor oxidoreductase family protein [Candidatus Mariimomonas ferrooxydans]
MKNDLQLIIAGFGGQGILFAGKLLTHSAMLEGRHVTGFPSYGAEIRGGTANCTVIISDEMIGSPIVRSPNSLLTMNQASMERFESQLKPHGILIMNTSLIKNPASRADIETIRINATDIAEELGNGNVANMVMLGALIGRTGIINPETVSSAMKEIIPGHRKNIIPLNERAFKKGIKEIAG